MSSVAGHRKRKHSTRSKPRTTTRSHKSHKENEPSSSLRPIAEERPATVEDLRKARVAYLETPSAERQKRMRYEYVKTVPIRVKTTVASVEATKAPSTISRTKSTAKRSINSRKAADKNSSSQDREDEEQYVYAARSSTARAEDSLPAQRNIDVRNAASRPERANEPLRNGRRIMTRSNTAPIITETSNRTRGETSTSSTPSQVKKSQTTGLDPSRPGLRRSVTSMDAKTEVSTAKSIPKRGSVGRSSFFGSLPPVPEKKVSCLTCGDQTFVWKTAKLPCAHRMCHACLERIFKLAITDPAHMPPRCCTERQIDLKHVKNVKALMNHDFQKTYNRKFKEYAAKNRIYCPARGCGEWIQPKHMSIDKGRKVGKCPKCKTRVCGICSQIMHKSRDCPEDPATKTFVETAKKAGWQKCYSCSAMVELKEGCNHMTCRCTAEFCMVCGLKWKSCDCPWFSYDQVDINGDPLRFQQEMDRRREQERRDEALARRMEGLDLEGGNVFDIFGVGNGAGHHMNQNFIRQAREVLTANYQQADQAARGLFQGLFAGQENEVAEMQAMANNTPQRLRQPVNRNRTRDNNNTPVDPAEGPQMTPAGIPVIVRHQTGRRRSTLQSLSDDRVQTAAEREQERRIRDWANNIPAT